MERTCPQTRRAESRAGKSASGYALRGFPRAFHIPQPSKKENFNNQTFGTLIHSRSFKKQRKALGQISIGRVGQYSIGADNCVNWFTSSVIK